jgi:hypothetical protein
MRMYHVRFLRNLTANGHEFCALQRIIPVADCEDREDAVRLAKQRFASLEHVDHWHLRADIIETSVAERAPMGEKAA